MSLKMSMLEWEEAMLALPLAGRVSGEHEEHQLESIPWKCFCDRCKIIRIKRRRAFRFPMTKCPSCGKLFVSPFHAKCEDCR